MFAIVLNVYHFSFTSTNRVLKIDHRVSSSSLVEILGTLKKKQGSAVQTPGVLNCLKFLDLDFVDWSQQKPEIHAAELTI